MQHRERYGIVLVEVESELLCATRRITQHIALVSRESNDLALELVFVGDAGPRWLAGFGGA